MSERNPFGQWTMSKYTSRLSTEEQVEYGRLARRYDSGTLTSAESERLEELQDLMEQRLAERNTEPTFTEEMEDYVAEIAARSGGGSGTPSEDPRSASH